MTTSYIPTAHLRILSIDPMSEGFGYAVLEKADPIRLVDWGTKTLARKTVYGVGMRNRLVELLDRFGPDVLVLQDFGDDWRRTERTRQFLDRATDLAKRRGIKVSRYTRDDVQRTFAEVDAVTKEEVARALTTIFPELLPQLPPHREFYMDEDSKMSIFDAVALGATHLSRER